MGIPEQQQPQQASLPTSYVLISLFTLILLSVSCVIYLSFLSPLSSIPGPLFASPSQL